MNKKKPTGIDALKSAVCIVGSQAKLAVLIGLSSQSAISHWVTGRKPIPAHRCRLIEAATGGKVNRAELRPDVFAE